ncbi:MAG: hypothetical protein OEM05_16210 [Myxococcales bacterium]|nr:hypothetical protein [Myxococcales bacterium]
MKAFDFGANCFGSPTRIGETSGFSCRGPIRPNATTPLGVFDPRRGIQAERAAAAAQAQAQAQEDEGYWIQVFALAGPSCPVVVVGQACPDFLLPGVELVLERLTRRRGAVAVARFETNANGYASVFVERPGMYRVDVPEAAPGELRAARPPFFLGAVEFRVPARHTAEDGSQLTPVVVNFDSGIR